MAEQQQTEEIPATDHVVKYSAKEAVLADLKSKYEGKVYPVTTPKGLDEARKARMEIREWRTGVEGERKKQNEKALAHQRAVNAEAKRITGLLVALEDPIDEQVKGEEERRDKEKAAKAELEAARLAGIQARLDIFRNATLNVGKAPGDIATAIETIKASEVTEELFSEFFEVAGIYRESAVTSLGALLADALDREVEQEKLRREREEIEKKRKEQEALAKAERERIKVETKEANRKLQEAQEAENRRILAERSKIEAERKENERKAEEAREAERKRIAQEKEWGDKVQAIRDIPYSIDPATTSSEEITALMHQNEAMVITEEEYGTRTEDAKAAITQAQVRLVDLRKMARERERQEQKALAERLDAEKQAREKERIEREAQDLRDRQARQKAEEIEKTRLAAEHRQRLIEARLDTPVSALLRILELAENFDGRPDHLEVRNEIRVICESNLLDVDEFGKLQAEVAPKDEKEQKAVKIPRKVKKGKVEVQADCR